MIVLGWSFVFAVEDTQLLDELEKLENTEFVDSAKTLNEKMKFESFSTCEDMNTVLVDFLKDNKDSFNWYHNRYYLDEDMPMMEVEESMADSNVVSADRAWVAEKTTSSNTDVSTTNIQVSWVDEPDIIKNDWDYLYYYNQASHKISIIQSPLDLSSSVVDLENAQVISTIKVPKTFNNVQLFLQKNKLVILWQRWRDGQWRTWLLERNQRVDIIVYDVSDLDTPRLERFTDLDWHYKDARLIDNELYVITQLHVNRWNAWQTLEKWEDIIIDDILPQAIDIGYKKEWIKNLEMWWKEYPYWITVEKSNCDDVLYVLPTKETLQEANIMPTFTVVRKVLIDEPTTAVQTTTAFGATQTIHMTKDSLYLADALWLWSNSACPPNARCIMPVFAWWQQHTLLHKFDIKSTWLGYRATTLIPWNPLTQYSMSEDNRGNFRLITQTWSPQLNTHLFILNNDLLLEWSVRNIQKNEELKSSRFIWNKLYLVTFERTDPLFVIDLSDTKNPAIIWELKIPWYSSYLHPYAAAANWMQYVIWLWYDTVENQWWWVTTAWVKIDLYKIDYTAKDDKWMIAVTQEYSEVFGKQWSRSEALENPRMVVWNEKTKQLVIPMLLQNQEKWQNCSIQYNAQWEEIGRRCYDSYTQDTTFAWMKALSITIDEGIEEVASYDYKDQLKKYNNNNDYDYDEEWPWEWEWTEQLHSRQFRQLFFRVGYLWDVLYALNSMFGHFAIDDQQHFISLQ